MTFAQKAIEIEKKYKGYEDDHLAKEAMDYEFQELTKEQEKVRQELGLAKGQILPIQYGKGGQWIQKAINPAHKGWCTPLSNPHCTGRRRALALLFKRKHGFHKKYGEGGYLDEDELYNPYIENSYMYAEGGPYKPLDIEQYGQPVGENIPTGVMEPNENFPGLNEGNIAEKFKLMNTLISRGWPQEKAKQAVFEGKYETLYPGKMNISNQGRGTLPYKPVPEQTINTELLPKPEMQTIGNVAKPGGYEYQIWLRENRDRLLKKYHLKNLNTKELENNHPKVLDNIRREFITRTKKIEQKKIEETQKQVIQRQNISSPIPEQVSAVNNR